VSNAAQISLPPLPGVFYMAMHTKIAPFNDVRVRRAVNFAVDRRVTEELFSGFGSTTCQILPPAFPGRTPYCPYTLNPGGSWTKPDVGTARKLVAQAGARNAAVTVWTSPDYYATLPLVQLGRYMVQVLNNIGLRATLKVVSGTEYGAAVYDPAGRVQMAFDAWSADYPSEPGFVDAILTCDAPLNAAHFCDPALDRAMVDASSVQFSDSNTAHRRWAAIEHRLVDLAPWVPLINRTQPLLLSDRVGNYQFSIGWGPLVDQMWVR
jgi:peptide/nickel transport system substrate-binding protein